MKNVKSGIVAGLLMSVGLVVGSAGGLSITQMAFAQDRDQTRACDKDGTCGGTPDQDRTRDQDKLNGTKDQVKDQDKLHDQDMNQLHDQDMDRAQGQLNTQGQGGSGNSTGTSSAGSHGNTGNGSDKGNQGPHQ